MTLHRDNKKYSESNKKGNKGESLFESIVGDYVISHKITKDIGIDFLCEWVNGEDPTGIVFAVQVKNFSSKLATKIGKDRRLNLLDQYKIEPSITINSRTQEYWRLLGMPCYLFVIIQNNKSVDLFYKRYTPIVEGKAIEPRSPFYKANDDLQFLAFAEDSIGGFARDLYIDQIRVNYYKGLIVYLNPRRLGLKQFPDTDRDVYFKDIFEEYKANFEETYRQLSSVFGNSNQLEATPSAPPDFSDEV